MKYLFFAVAILYYNPAFAQKQDYVWLLGYAGGNQSTLNDSFGISILRFDSLNQLSIVNNQSCDLNLSGTNSTVSDSTGNLLFFTNGEKVYNSNYSLMSNGNNLNVSNGYGTRQPQGALSLPIPNQKDKYLMLISEDNYFSTELLYAGYKVYKNIIDMSESNGLGKVTEKKVEMIQDTLEWGQINAVKHANGRDSWILIPESYSNRYYIMLLDPTGLSTLDTQSIGIPFIDGLGQAVFSPDGTKYARANGVKLSEPTHLFVYDFDRSTGNLSNSFHFEYETTGLGTGCAFSPNSRFLYVVSRQKIWQFDLWASDIQSSQTLVAEWDGFVHNGQFSTTFALAQLAPDGRIYIGCPNGNRYLHVIEYPNRKGIACQVRQRAVKLPNYYDYGIPNFPNYRLGPIDGSACDTLGFDNHPLCNWRWEQEDTLAPLQVTFTDLSAYEPAHWHWDFGDGNTSQDTSPVHTYMANGIYQVCLIVNNLYSADTFCQVLNLGLSGSVEAEQVNASTLRLVPNPADETLHLLSTADLNEVRIQLYNMTGSLVLSDLIENGLSSRSLNVSNLPSGVYFYRILLQEKVVQSGKVIISH